MPLPDGPSCGNGTLWDQLYIFYGNSGRILHSTAFLIASHTFLNDSSTNSHAPFSNSTMQHVAYLLRTLCTRFGSNMTSPICINFFIMYSTLICENVLANTIAPYTFPFQHILQILLILILL